MTAEHVATPPRTTAHKAVAAGIAFVVAVLGSLVVAVTSGSEGGTSITAAEWLQAAFVAFTGLGGTYGVYQVTNRPKE